MQATLAADTGGVLRGAASTGVRATASQPPPEAGDPSGREPAEPGAAGRGLRKLARDGAGSGDGASERLAESGAMRSATRGLPSL